MFVLQSVVHLHHQTLGLGPPTQDAIVANEGLDWDSLLNM